MNSIAEFLSAYHGAEIAGALSAACFLMAWHLLRRSAPRQSRIW